MPCAYNMHAPFPSQLPLCWQVVLASTTHFVVRVGTGGHGTAFAVRARGLLTCAASLAEPRTGESQQSPSARLPLAHCEANVHIRADRLIRLARAVARSAELVATQSESELHVKRHAVAPHTYGAHELWPPGLHEPSPSQT